ncbi:hypothetical protein K0U83_11555 [bacterium]|nr:hypothetical protein [bacterium]
MPEISGENIREVWDYRLSNATPLIDRRGGTWVAQVWAKANPDYDPADPSTLAAPLEVYDTGIPATPGDEHDPEKVLACYVWFLAVRDEYARADIEELKPFVATINQATAELALRGAV